MDELIDNIHVCIDKTAQNIVQLMCCKNLRLATAESCTGGLLSGAVTSIAGSSQMFEFGLCAYANRIKTLYLGVRPETLEVYGAVSEQCAQEMAAGIRKAAGVDIGLSVTGIAGPDGGTNEKPVGTVYVSCSYKDSMKTVHLKISPPGRAHIRRETCRQALILLYNIIKDDYEIENN